MDTRTGTDLAPPPTTTANRPTYDTSTPQRGALTGSSRDGFLIALNDRLRSLRDPVDVQREAVRVLGEHLRVTWVHYAECEDDLSAVTIRNEYRPAGLPSLVGQRTLVGCERLIAELSAGRTVAVEDIRASSLIDESRRAEFVAHGSISFIATPISKDGRLIATISVVDGKTRAWRRDELALLEETAERTWFAVDRARAEQAVAIELRDMRLLHELSARLVSENDTDAFFDAILAAAIAITNALGGTLRLVDHTSGELVLLATRGLDERLTKRLRHLPPDWNTTTSRAVATGQRSFTDFADPSAPDLYGLRRLHLEVGVRSALSTPLITRDGRAIGTLTMHWSDVHPSTDRERRSIDMVVRQTADLIERRRADDALRASQARLSDELEDMKLLQALSAQLIQEDDSSTLHQTLVEAASAIMHSDFAVLQILHPERGPHGELQLLASRGFTPDVTKAWEWVSWDAGTTCGLAMRKTTRVVAGDIEMPELDIGDVERATYLRIGVRSAQSTPLVSRGGKTVGMISTFWRETREPSERDLRLLDIVARQAADLIERAQAAEALRRNEIALKEADRRKDEFIAVLAHELRNPLAPIRTSLESMRLAGHRPDVLEEARSMMERQVGHMVRLIDDLLDVSRIASGKIELQRQHTLLRSLVNTAIETNRGLLAAGRIALDLDLPDEPLLLDVDPTRFIQILSNVLHNAVKFSQPGGRVRVAVAIERGADAAGEVRFVIADSGAGISPALLPHVFELFTQDAASAASRRGLGIGLALARQLVEMHGGSIEARSEGPGFGSSFTIRVPLPAEAGSVPGSESHRETPQIRRRVLVIDDNVDAANAMKRLVTLMGGDCRAAYGGEMGLAAVLEFRPDIVFLDIGMPGMDGYEVCRRIRRELGPEIFVVALTGWGQERDKAGSARAGFDVHLTKPADPMALEAILTAARSI